MQYTYARSDKLDHRNSFKNYIKNNSGSFLRLVVGDGPTVIIVNSMIRSISKIDDYKMVSLNIVSPNHGPVTGIP